MVGLYLKIISIHTPTKGATDIIILKFHFFIISIHTPTKGATQSLQPQTRTYKFQSTLPRRERHNLYRHKRGLTNFNPHSHEGSDTPRYLRCTCSFRFQSTLPRRERHLTYEVSNDSTLFQSTLPRRERRYCQNIFGFLFDISIHTPTKGATLSIPVKKWEEFDFNPHSHEGSDIRTCCNVCRSWISIHTPTKGATAILTNNFLIFCSISLINFILYLQIIQILFIVRYKFIFYFIF